jgi:isopentenyl phosphate kinase
MIFLKLGGSLITEKAGVEQARLDVIQRLAQEISEAVAQSSGLKLVVGHGSGSFGHRAAQRFGTHLGAKTAEQWKGFSEVWGAANRLHRTFLDSLRVEGLPAISFPPSSLAVAEDGHIIAFGLEPIQTALSKGLLPIIYGDVAFDRVRGATILSTEQVLAYLAEMLEPDRLLLAGKETGILDSAGDLIPELSERDLGAIPFHDPEGADVTGGMKAKVQQAIDLAGRIPGLEILIFSAEKAGTLRDVLLGASTGTRILAS